MDKSQMISLFDQYQRRDITYPGMRREVTPFVVRHIDASETGLGLIVYSRINELNAEDSIHEQVNFFEDIKQDFKWKVYDFDKPSDLKERLASHGFIINEPEAIEVLDLEDAPEILWHPIRHNVQRITEPKKLLDVQTIEQQVWNEDSSWVLQYLGEALTNYPDQMSVYIAYVDEQPAGAGWIYFPEHSQFASLWGGATVRRFRKQGIFTALVATRAQEAKARQVRYLTVDAMPMSRPILEKHGFELLAYVYPCEWKSQNQKETK